MYFVWGLYVGIVCVHACVWACVYMHACMYTYVYIINIY